MSAAEQNSHRHGNWTGLFKLAEECGELVVALTEAEICAAPDVDRAVMIAAIGDEIADVGAACSHVEQANGLDGERIAARCLRQVAWLQRLELPPETMVGRSALVHRCGALV